MSYTPTTWANGDTITAAKLNNMEGGIEDAQNGWSVESTQLFSETVTTASGQFGYQATLTYATELTASTLVITFDGTDYTCAQQSGNGMIWYGAPDPSDFSTYPFCLLGSGTTNYVITETAGTYTISAATSGVTTTANFQAAVNSVTGTITSPMECVNGATTGQEMYEAYTNGRILFFKPRAGVNQIRYITSFTSSAVSFVPEESNVTATFENGVFTVTVSV